MSAGPVLEPGEEEVSDRILTAPNLITLVRLACLPLFLYLLFTRDNPAGAALLLAALGATDWVDGYVARRFHQVSTVGKVLDPVADRLLFFVGVGAIVIDGRAPAWFSVLVLARELFVSVAVLVLAALGAKRIDVTWFGKAGTFCLMFAFPLFLAGSDPNLGVADLATYAAWGFGVPGLVLSYYAAVLYVPLGLKALRDGRAARRAGLVEEAS
ncbi:MAG: CDP-alcohol phosphatidyltransferase family protein [Acidimicrobiales bacterium]|nr:CDP-alcohol phosphatidyltransferase family protein [Acidimicrobiales bacterium]MCB1013997.1 CDP-alcohol phosphatidyltransferase family protein [Acidimicrobiales bacterium]MCB9371407.1 CDP-alcohol phosphatidyltransferase family protein [Microthrixaceae bacterium]